MCCVLPCDTGSAVDEETPSTIHANGKQARGKRTWRGLLAIGNSGSGGWNRRPRGYCTYVHGKKKKTKKHGWSGGRHMRAAKLVGAAGASAQEQARSIQSREWYRTFSLGVIVTSSEDNERVAASSTCALFTLQSPQRCIFHP